METRRAIAVVIVNYRSSRLVVECLQTLEPEVRRPWRLQVYVVDNASPDDSLAILEQAVADRDWGHWVRILAAPTNGGFASGNNFAIRPLVAGHLGEDPLSIRRQPSHQLTVETADSSDAPPALIWLLNPDTLVSERSLSALVDFLDRHPEVGIVGSRLVSRDRTSQTSVMRFPSILGELETIARVGVVSRLLSRWRIMQPLPKTEAIVDWVPGASMLVRRAAFQAAGLLDDQYFMYYEETDFCLACRRLGILCGFTPESEVVHLEGESSGIRKGTDRERARPTYWFRSRERYFRKNYGRLYAMAANLGWIGGYAIYRITRILFWKPVMTPPGMASQIWRTAWLGNAELSP